jgi:hypothetical protein
MTSTNRITRRLALLCSVAALAVAAVPATSAHADALRAGGVPVAAGFVVNANSTLSTFTGVFAQTISCPASTLTYTVIANNAAGLPVRGNLNNWTFAGCTMPGPPVINCTVTAGGLPWPNSVWMFDPTKSVAIGFPPQRLLIVTCNFPAPVGAVTCTYTGAGAAPPPVTNISGGWTDSPGGGGPAVINYLNAGLNLVGGPAMCGPGALFSSKYLTAAGNLTLTP